MYLAGVFFVADSTFDCAYLYTWCFGIGLFSLAIIFGIMHVLYVDEIDASMKFSIIRYRSHIASSGMGGGVIRNAMSDYGGGEGK